MSLTMKLEAKTEAVIFPEGVVSSGEGSWNEEGGGDARQSLQLQMKVSTRSGPSTGCGGFAR